MDRGSVLALMRDRHVRQVPVVDERGRVVDLIVADDGLPPEVLHVRAVVMAGGYGKRLLPLTANLAKPMLPVGERPLLELMVKQLGEAGIRRIHMMTHYKPETISEHFGNGEEFGVQIDYVPENEPMGTAGGLALLDESDERLLVINGDVMTRIDFQSMLNFHQEHGSDLTVGVRSYELEVPYGVMECDGVEVRSIKEKPAVRFLVNAGVYLLEPNVRTYLPRQRHCDMTELIQALIRAGRRVISFPIVEYWLDIGQPGDYAQAQVDFAAGKFS
jgi:NDP-sugar pyrophosphorylase family protein